MGIIAWSAFVMGLVGSLHCVGMCGPIMLALPVPAAERWSLALRWLVYHFGRITTYAFLGTLTGLLGTGLATAGFQTSFSIGLGVLILISVLIAFPLEGYLRKLPLFQRMMQWTQRKMGPLLNRQDHWSFFQLGMLNGLLPCGLVYVAIAGAVTTTSGIGGTIYMMAFGLGTIPLLMLTALAATKVRAFRQIPWRKIYPVALFGLGLFFIYRGVALQIPSDLTMWEAFQNLPMCH